MLDDGGTDSIEFFTTNRTPKMTRHVFEEKFFPGVFGAFLEIFGFPSCPGKPLLDLVRLG
jgi:hypothetical protein